MVDAGWRFKEALVLEREKDASRSSTSREWGHEKDCSALIGYSAERAHGAYAPRLVPGLRVASRVSLSAPPSAIAFARISEAPHPAAAMFPTSSA